MAGRRLTLDERIEHDSLKEYYDHPLLLHSDNGSPMKGATILSTLYDLEITPSNSRPRASNDNPYSESLFKTLEYRPNYQPKGLKNIEEAGAWYQLFVK